MDRAGLLRIERERGGGKPRRQRLADTDGVDFVLEPDDDVIGLAHDHDFALGFLPSPAVTSQLEGIMQLRFGEQR